MAAPDPLPAAEQFTASDWKEWVANFRPSGANSFSQEGGEAVLTGLVPAAKVRGCLRFLLGWNSVTTSAPFLLQRTNPVFHPRYARLACTSAGEEEFKPGGRGGGAVAALKTAAASAIIGGTSIANRTGYQWARVTARFQPIQWNLAEDTGINRLDAEDSRNTWRDVEPRTEFLSLDGFQLIFAEGAGNTPPLTNPNGKAFPAPFGQLLVKPDITISWKHVPERFVLENPPGGSPSNGLPTNILRCMGKVNSTAFRGAPIGTLLLLGARMLRTPWALADGFEDLNNYQITFFFGHFNPTKGKSANVQLNPGLGLGWNNFPWRGTATAAATVAGDTNAGKWFVATRTGGGGAVAADGSTIDPRLIEYADFQDLFRQAV